jgi:hypothetical protein
MYFGRPRGPGSIRKHTQLATFRDEILVVGTDASQSRVVRLSPCRGSGRSMQAVGGSES